jgi:tetratricopeptide (TPR) repeat protein
MIKKRRNILFILFFLMVSMSTFIIRAEDNLQELLKQYISDLQKNPNDNALREKIIKLVQGMKPAPEIPEEARKHFIKAGTLLKGAKDTSGYELAVSEYKQTLLIAPWWSEAYYNYATALELANRFDESINIIKLYLLTNPSPNDARIAQDKIYAIEAKKEIAQAEKTVKGEETDFSGIWVQNPVETCWRYKFAVNGKEIVITTFCPNMDDEQLEGWATLNGRTFEGKMNTSPDKYGATACAGGIKGVISEDNRNIKISFPSCHGGTYGYNLVRE